MIKYFNLLMLTLVIVSCCNNIYCAEWEKGYSIQGQLNKERPHSQSHSLKPNNQTVQRLSPTVPKTINQTLYKEIINFHNFDECIKKMYKSLCDYEDDIRNNKIYDECFVNKGKLNGIVKEEKDWKGKTFKKINPYKCPHRFFEIIVDNLNFQTCSNFNNLPDHPDKSFIKYANTQYNININELSEPLSSINSTIQREREGMIDDIKQARENTIYCVNTLFNNFYSYLKLPFPIDDNKCWEQLLMKSYEWRLSRENSYKEWYCKQHHTFIFSEFSPSNKAIRNYIFNNFNKVSPSKEEIYVAEELLKVLQEWGINDSIIDKEDCRKRPWYVIGCFFEFVSIQHRIPQTLQEEQKTILLNDLKEFFPISPYEFYKFDWLKEPNYYERVKIGILQWLIDRFGFTDSELGNKTLNELLEILKHQFEKVKPYHRYLKMNVNDEKLQKFLDRFL